MVLADEREWSCGGVFAPHRSCEVEGWRGDSVWKFRGVGLESEAGRGATAREKGISCFVTPRANGRDVRFSLRGRCDVHVVNNWIREREGDSASGRHFAQKYVIVRLRDAEVFPPRWRSPASYVFFASIFRLRVNCISTSSSRTSPSALVGSRHELINPRGDDACGKPDRSMISATAFVSIGSVRRWRGVVRAHGARGMSRRMCGGEKSVSERRASARRFSSSSLQLHERIHPPLAAP